MIPNWQEATSEYTFKLTEDGHHRIVRKEQPDGSFLWAVYGPHSDRYCLSVTGEWSFESLPSHRSDDWYSTHRFPTKEAAYDRMIQTIQKAAR